MSDPVVKLIEGIETKLDAFAEKAATEVKDAKSTSAETKAAIDKLGQAQLEFAQRLVAIEQRGGTPAAADGAETWGKQLIKADAYRAFVSGAQSKLRLEVKNTLTGSDTNVAPDRKPGIVGGAFQVLTAESLFTAVPTASNAIEFTKENAFTNSAAEASEGAAKAESALTWTLVNMPVSTVAHWIKISRQLAADNAALAAYVDTRMRYGVQKRVDTQLVAGDGTAPNISGFMDTGNFTAHGYADAALGTVLKKIVLVRKVIADLWAAGYPADAIVFNPADWATIEIDLLTVQAGKVPFQIDAAGVPRLFGVPVVQSNGMTADLFAVGRFSEAGTIYNREGVVVEMSDSDSDNFTKNLITIRAERRLALATERPAAIRAGDLTPA